MEIRAQWQPWYGGISILMREPGDVRTGKPTRVVGPLTLKEIKPGEACGPPTLTMEREELQVLVDDLYQMGFRPSDGEHTTGQLRATENHLNDMRKIAFKGLAT